MTTPSDQLVLGFPQSGSMAEADFIAGEANSLALAWIGRWPDWPARRLCLWGPPGCGKSHLAAIWAARRADDPGAVVVEGAEACAGDAVAERALLHRLNLTAELGGSVLLTATQPPARWGVMLPDLASRLAAIAAIAIATPDEALMQAVLGKHLADRQVVVDPEVLRFLALRLPRSLEAACDAAARLDQASLASGRRISRALAAAVLERRRDDAAKHDNPMEPAPEASHASARLL